MPLWEAIKEPPTTLRPRIKKPLPREGQRFFFVYDEPSTDLCLHKNLYVADIQDSWRFRRTARSFFIIYCSSPGTGLFRRQP